MQHQARDFQVESDELHVLVAGLSADELTRPTRFKGWSSEDIVGHLHFGNQAVDLALADPDAFRSLRQDILTHLTGGASLRDLERAKMQGLAGHELVAAWREHYGTVGQRFAAADPRLRIPWIGPDMTVQTALSGRLMETWAHGQAIYDAADLERPGTDRLSSIAVLGVATYEWSFANRRLPVPGPIPEVRLEAPSGEIWTYGSSAGAGHVEGPAEAFCQVVTQTRNVGDTPLEVVGSAASAWMAIAQCFGGPPVDPPAPGVRGRSHPAWSG